MNHGSRISLEIQEQTKNKMKQEQCTSRYRDAGGGFWLKSPNSKIDALIPERLPPIYEPDRPQCQNCRKTITSSWLYDNFDLKCCDACKNPNLHKLITKTEATRKYLLKTADLDQRHPPLKFIQRKNPHNATWGVMRLYLQVQVENRELQVWGSKAKIEAEKQRRKMNNSKRQVKNYQKKLKELRRKMQSTNVVKNTPHVHQYSTEWYNEENDTYTRTCSLCDYKETFEKM